MKIILRFCMLFLLIITPLFAPANTYAQGSWDEDCFNKNIRGAEDVATLHCLPSVVLNATNAFLLFAGTVALFIIVWAGIRLVTSGGDAKQVQSARSMITYAIIGLIIVLSSYAILFFIGYLTRTSDCITNVNSITTGC